jgi:hypothetical protein
MYFSSINENDVPFIREASTAPRNPNSYYDIHKLVDSIDYLVQQSHIEDPELKDFLVFALPEEYKCRTKTLSREETIKLNLVEVCHVDIKQILNHSYFQELCNDHNDILTTYKIQTL